MVSGSGSPRMPRNDARRRGRGTKTVQAPRLRHRQGPENPVLPHPDDGTVSATPYLPRRHTKDSALAARNESGICAVIVKIHSPVTGAGMAMKMITAIIRPHKLGDLEQAVARIGVQGMTVTEVQGYGRQHGHLEVYRDAQYRVDFTPRIQVQIAVDDSLVEPLVEAIANVTRTGKIGDGRIFVAGVGQAIRIRTGETGAAAT